MCEHHTESKANHILPVPSFDQLLPAKVEKLRKEIGRDFSEQDKEDISFIMEGFHRLIKLCGDDPDREGVLETPFRAVKAFLENTKGLRFDTAEEILSTKFSTDNNSMVIVKDIEFHSMCEHHLLPIIGKAHIGYIPSGKVAGLSKFARILEHYGKRFQIQEQLTKQIADAIAVNLETEHVMVVIDAEHTCMSMRGVQKQCSSTITSSASGYFERDSKSRAEFMSLIKK